jgi:uncharacterized membrane protein YtjA (UPF0391 family)
MFSWAIAFLVIALIAGTLGFGVVARTEKVVFVVALTAFFVSAVLGVTQRGCHRPGRRPAKFGRSKNTLRNAQPSGAPHVARACLA